MMIEIDKSTFRYKAYAFGDLLWNKFMGRDWDTRNMTDTCSYFRTFLFKVPLVLVVNVVAFWWILNCLIFWPIQAFGFVDYSVGFVAWAVGITGVLGTIVVISYLVSRFFDWIGKRDKKDKPSLVKEAYKGFKEKYCPMIKFVGGNTDV